MYLNKKLSQIVYDNGTSTVFSYGSDGLIESITDPAGRVTRLTRDTQQNLTQIIDPDNNSRGFEYNANHTLIAQTDKISRAKNYAYDTRGSVIHSVQSDNTFRGIKSSKTDTNGEFTISGIPHGAQIVSLDATGLTASNGHQYANFKGRLKILPNVLNRPHRNYMLPRVNPDHISMVNPARGRQR